MIWRKKKEKKETLPNGYYWMPPAGTEYAAWRLGDRNGKSLAEVTRLKSGNWLVEIPERRDAKFVCVESAKRYCESVFVEPVSSDEVSELERIVKLT